MAPATKATKFAIYRDPSLPNSKPNQAQEYEVLVQEKHEIADWSMILTAAKVVMFDDAIEFEEVKARAAMKSELGMAFTPSKKLRLTQEESGLD
jgi:hypothetical protein